MTESVIVQIGLAGLGALLLMLALWIVHLKTGDAGLVDFGWSLGLGLVAIYYSVSSEGYPPRRFMLALLAGFWAFRLAFYLLFNRVLRGPEDGRYRKLRERWGDRAPGYFLLFFLFQSLLVVGFSIPYLVVAWNPHEPLGWTDLAAVMTILGSVVGESIADRQLSRFRRDPRNKGKVCRDGLWRYSRHPNYFFEWLHWWAWVMLAFGSSLWWLSLIGPLLMLAFLFKVTGIPATEAQALSSRGEAYRQYQRTTSAFFPWFPKEDRE